jgi:hypothetical protein
MHTKHIYILHVHVYVYICVYGIYAFMNMSLQLIKRCEHSLLEVGVVLA